MTRDPKKRKEWNNRNTRFIGVRLMNSTDADIIQYMDKKQEEGETKQGIIKRSLRKTMEDEGFSPGIAPEDGESKED